MKNTIRLIGLVLIWKSPKPKKKQTIPGLLPIQPGMLLLTISSRLEKNSTTKPTANCNGLTTKAISMSAKISPSMFSARPGINTAWRNIRTRS